MTIPNDITITGKFQTDFKTYLIVDANGIVYSMKLVGKDDFLVDAHSVALHVYIAQCIEEGRDELDSPVIMPENQTGRFAIGIRPGHTEIDIYRIKEPVDQTNLH